MNQKEARQILDKYQDVLYLDCPFCADKENRPMLCFHRFANFSDVHFTVSCTGCGCEPDFCVENPEQAISLWNTRANVGKNTSSVSGFELAKKEILKLINELIPDHCLITK